MDPKTANIIAAALEDEIIAGKLAPGTALQQEVLADRFNVSRQPVRAALQVLAAKELVARRPDRSVEVTGLSPSVGSEVLSIRILLEPEALAQAIPNLTVQDLLLARQALERFEYEDSPERLGQHDLEFHLALYRPCHNETMIGLITSLRKSNQRAYLGQPLGSKSRQSCIESHGEILEAVSDRDENRARKLLVAHFDIARERKQ